MLGYLSGMASWAFGVRFDEAGLPPVPSTEAELRAQRIARLQQPTTSTTAATAPTANATITTETSTATTGTSTTGTTSLVMASLVTSTPSGTNEIDAMETSDTTVQVATASSNHKETEPNRMEIDAEPTMSVATIESVALRGVSPVTISPVVASLAKTVKRTTGTKEAKPVKHEPLSLQLQEPQPKSEMLNSGNKKLQCMRESLLRKCLKVQLVNGSAAGNASTSVEPGITLVDTGSTEISVATIAEIVALVLSMEPSLSSVKDARWTTTSTVTTITSTNIAITAAPLRPPQKQLAITYLGASFNRVAQELKSLHTATGKKTTSNTWQVEMLLEMQKQTVAFAATCFLQPNVFPHMAKNMDEQLSIALLVITAESNIVLGGVHSFYYQVVQELVQRPGGIDCLKQTMTTVVQFIASILEKSESVLDSIPVPGGDGASISPTTAVTALTSLCLHKNAAMVVQELDTFLLPAAGTREAETMIRPPPMSTSGLRAVHQLLAVRSGTLARSEYKLRSGPGLAASTLLGLMLRSGAERSRSSTLAVLTDPAILQSLTTAIPEQRQRLTSHQEACFQFIKTLLKNGGPRARANVMTWFKDALLVNTGASALYPDESKVSRSSLLLNVYMMLLKLCEPFVTDESKQRLIDAGFVSAPLAHGGVFAAAGADAAPRLGQSGGSTNGASSYSPKNDFVPQVFFFCARALHLSVAPLLRRHENLTGMVRHSVSALAPQGQIVLDRNVTSLVLRIGMEEVSLFQEELVASSLQFCDLLAKILHEMDDATLVHMPEEFVSNICDVLSDLAKRRPQLLVGHKFPNVFKLVVRLISPKYAGVIRNYNLRAQLGDELFDVFLPRRPSPATNTTVVAMSTDPTTGGPSMYLLSDSSAQKTLAPSLLHLYGEVEQTGFYDKMSHRTKIATLIKYLWDSSEHRVAFRRITQHKASFIQFANGIMNETNLLIATVMQKLPEIREAQEQTKNKVDWGRLSAEEKRQISTRLEDNERDVKAALPLCNKTLQMLAYLNMDPEIRKLFLLDELCSRLASMLIQCLGKLVGTKGMDLKVDNPEKLEFRPKEMLRDLCAIFAHFASSDIFQNECAKAGCDSNLLRSVVKTCRRLHLLELESMLAFTALPDAIDAASSRVALEEDMLMGAPDEFLDEILSTFMKDPVVLPSGHFVDRSTITQHLLNDPMDPFSRQPLTADQVQPAVDLKRRMEAWLEEKHSARRSRSGDHGGSGMQVG